MIFKNTLSIVFLLVINYIFSQSTNLEIPKFEPGKKAFNDVKETSVESIYETVEQAAEFPGSMNSLRRKFADNFDASSFEGEGSIQAEVAFVVERDGSMSQLIATGPNPNFNKEAIRTLMQIQTKWMPAKVNGLPVRSKFRFPIRMNFQ